MIGGDLHLYIAQYGPNMSNHRDEVGIGVRIADILRFFRSLYVLISSAERGGGEWRRSQAKADDFMLLKNFRMAAIISLTEQRKR